MTFYDSHHQQKYLPLRPDATTNEDGDNSMTVPRKPIMTNSLPLLSTSAATSGSTATSNTTTVEKKHANRYKIDINLATEIKRLNAEIWNLEVSRQEQMEQNQALNQALARSHMDQARMIRQQTLVNQELELLKAVQDSWSREDSDNSEQMSQLNEMVQQRRKEAAALLSTSPQPTIVETSLSSSNKDKEQDKRYQITKKLVDEHVRNIGDGIEDYDDDDASSYTSDPTARNIDDISTRCQQKKEHEERTAIDCVITREQQKHQLDDEDYGVCIVKKQCQHQQDRPHTWTFTELPPVSNLDTIADEERRQQHQRVEYNDNDNQHCGKIMRRSLSTSVRLRRTLSAMSSSSLLRVDENQLLVTDGIRLKHKKVLATGDWMWKFTRNKTTRVGFSTERRHLRFVWLEPGARTLYWKNRATSESPKSARIKSFVVEIPKDEKQIPVLVFRAEDREIKVQCMSLDTHSNWVQALGYTIGMGSLRRVSRRSRLFGGESGALSQRSSRFFRRVPTIRSLRSISSFCRRENDYRDSGVASTTSWGDFDYQQQQRHPHEHQTQQGDCNNLSLDPIGSASGFSSALSSNFDPNSLEQQQSSQLHRKVSKRISRRLTFGAYKQHQPFAIDVQNSQPYDSKLQC
ncbi:hypothetical protein BDB00DRAFT_933550 [Zychaea mexicana]|uniref:uncharacterized protein n=1 Tax=Zychaea mexicana TaxID=64656 RepID=UPI0022FE1623|nr:uncharacterized protein BDB00DRAFT_933550 [Zychaea mexicana]KAI9484581.1 hypothetical protein BDB00DRAFT_933550 [Zychaea mexicana]